jgi:hypothetical protein
MDQINYYHEEAERVSKGQEQTEYYFPPRQTGCQFCTDPWHGAQQIEQFFLTERSENLKKPLLSLLSNSSADNGDR